MNVSYVGTRVVRREATLTFASLAMPSFASARHPAPVLPLLFARYVAGRIAQTQWDDFASAFDEADASADERAAFAAFYLETTSAGDEVKLPKPDELEDLLAATRL